MKMVVTSVGLRVMFDIERRQRNLFLPRPMTPTAFQPEWLAGSTLQTALENGSLCCLFYWKDYCTIQTVLLGAVSSHLRARPAASQSFS